MITPAVFAFSPWPPRLRFTQTARWGLSLALMPWVLNSLAGAAAAQSPPAPPPPSSVYANTGSSLPGQQYVVFVRGNSPRLLEQIRQVEPDAFLSSLDGQSVIQVGRFNFWENAQQRVNEMAQMGVGAEIQESAPASSLPPSPPAAAPTRFPSGAGSAITDLPPLPTTAAPSTVEFGQIPSTAPSTAVPPGSPEATLPPPPSSSVSLPATSASLSGYYVVIPAGRSTLSTIANDVVSLGAPANLVQPREAPRGPHVAVGPFADRGVANDWSRYLENAGLDARVHYE